MRIAVAVAVLGFIAGSARADVMPAGGAEPSAGPVAIEQVGGRSTHSLVARSAVVDHRIGAAVPVTTRLNPVVGSVERGHTNPVTHKSSYRSTVYNPVLGSFGKYKFRR